MRDKQEFFYSIFMQWISSHIYWEWIQELKPLITLFLEQYWTIDELTKKPQFDGTKIGEIKEKFLQHWWNESDWDLILNEYGTISPINTLRVRKYLRDVKQIPDESWNVYWNKEKILDKIGEIMRWHSAKKWD